MKKSKVATRKCKHCGKSFEFIKYKSAVKSGKGKYCSQACQFNSYHGRKLPVATKIKMVKSKLNWLNNSPQTNYWNEINKFKKIDKFLAEHTTKDLCFWTIGKKGRVQVHVPGTINDRVLWHRYLIYRVHKIAGLALPMPFVVHHVDRDPSNNSLRNLECFPSHSAHMLLAHGKRSKNDRGD